MSELNFQIHSEPGGVSVSTFREAIYRAIYVLREFDAGISKHPLGTLAWYVNKLNSNGSLSVNFISRLKPPAMKDNLPDISPRVTDNFLTGFEDLEEKCITPPYLSEFGLQKAGELAGLIKKNGATGFRFAVEDRKIEVTSRTAENVSKLRQINRTAVGSVEGTLEEISVHRSKRKKDDQKLRSVVYHSITNRAITCLFDEDNLDAVKEALGKRVLVFGKLQKNIKGETMRVLIENLEIIEGKMRFEMPNVGGTLGVPDFENEESTEQYMRRVRGG